jgi:hypothetical protein
MRMTTITCAIAFALFVCGCGDKTPEPVDGSLLAGVHSLLSITDVSEPRQFEIKARNGDVLGRVNIEEPASAMEVLYQSKSGSSQDLTGYLDKYFLYAGEGFQPGMKFEIGTYFPPEQDDPCLLIGMANDQNEMGLLVFAYDRGQSRWNRIGHLEANDMVHFSGNDIALTQGTSGTRYAYAFRNNMVVDQEGNQENPDRTSYSDPVYDDAYSGDDDSYGDYGSSSSTISEGMNWLTEGNGGWISVEPKYDSENDVMVRAVVIFKSGYDESSGRMTMGYVTAETGYDVGEPSTGSFTITSFDGSTVAFTTSGGSSGTMVRTSNDRAMFNGLLEMMRARAN